MSKVTVNNFIGLINPKDMEIGQYGIVKDPGCESNDEIVLCCYDCVVSLNDPSSTYERTNSAVKILPLPKGTIITIVI